MISSSSLPRSQAADLGKQTPRPQPQEPIEVLNLSVRAYKCLKRQGLASVGEVASLSDEELLSIWHLGMVTLAEIRAKLADYELQENDSTGPSDQARVRLPLEGRTTSEDSESASPSTHLKTLGLSIRAYNALGRAGIRTVQQLAAASTQDIRDVPNIGDKSMAEIQEKLATYSAKNPDFSRPVLSPTDPVSPSSSGQDETAVTSESPPRSPMNAPFELLSLSAPCSDALRMAGCETIGDVAALLEVGVPWALRCLDQESRSEITERLDAFFAKYPSLSRPTPLEVLNLSVRCYNALMRCGIYTVEKLARLSDQEIWDIRNIGSKSLAEIEDKLETYLKIYPQPDQPVSLPSEPNPLPPSPAPRSLVDQEMISTIEDKDIPLDTISVERLALSEWDLILLGKAGVETLGHLVRQPRDRWKREAEIIQHLEEYLRWVVEQDEVVWANEAADRGISPLYRLKLAETSLSDLTEEWLGPLTSRQNKIIRLRYGLQGEELTFRAIGKRLDLSGARIQQLQSKILRILQTPQCCTTIRPLNALLVYLLEQAGGLLNAAQLDTALRTEVVIGEVDPVGVARLAFEVHDGVEWLRKTEAWGLTSSPLVRVPDIQKRLVSVLEKAYAPLPCETVTARLKATRYYRTHRDELEDRFIVACLKTHLEIEIDESGLCGLTKWEKRKLDEVVLALRQIGRPVHYSVIAERANALLPSDQRTSERNIWAILDRYSTIFVCLGRGRYWLRDHLITQKAGKAEVDFGDLFGDRLTRWQEELDRRKAESEFDAHAEVDKIRQVGLDFFDE